MSMHYVAFLRAVNVGGRTITMDALRRAFEKAGFSDVETFIASGNVMFSSALREAAIVRAVERQLVASFGFEVPAFVRTSDELAAAAAHEPFTAEQLASAVALNVAFVAEPIDAAAKRRVGALTTDIDAFDMRGREVYWLCRRKQSESKISNKVLEKALGHPATTRSVTTVRRLAARLAAAR